MASAEERYELITSRLKEVFGTELNKNGEKYQNATGASWCFHFDRNYPNRSSYVDLCRLQTASLKSFDAVHIGHFVSFTTIDSKFPQNGAEVNILLAGTPHSQYPMHAHWPEHARSAACISRQLESRSRHSSVGFRTGTGNTAVFCKRVLRVRVRCGLSVPAHTPYSH